MVNPRTYELPDDEARLLNMIHRESPNAGCSAAAIVARAEVEAAYLADLGHAKLVRVDYQGLEIALDALEADPGLLKAYDIRVTPTAAGRRWVVENPTNSMLTYLADGRGRAPLLELKRHTNIEHAEGEILNVLRDARLIEIRDAVDRDVRRLRVRIAYSDRWLISITSAGRRFAGHP